MKIHELLYLTSIVFMSNSFIYLGGNKSAVIIGIVGLVCALLAIYSKWSV